ncbi:MAG: Ig-like domain-containing protein [Candidatus Weimeria sp.]
MRFKKCLAAVLAAAMVASVVTPVSAFAYDPTDDSSYSSDDGYDYDDDVSDDDDEEPVTDYSAIGLSQTSITLLGNPDDWSNSYSASGSIPLTGVPKGAYFSYDAISNVQSSNSKMTVDSYDFEIDYDNSLQFTVYGVGTTTITFDLGTKQLSFQVTVIEPAHISSGAYLMAKGNTRQLKIKGSTKGATVTYKSLSPSVVSVSQTGKIKALKVGSAVIKVTFDYGDNNVLYSGTVINVASPNRAAVYKWARSYAAKSTYSQPKRMLKGYYDCSSLVWRAYRSRGIYLANKYYAPTAADLAKYLVGKGKKVGAASYKNFQARKFVVGDLLFETGENNGRYKGIYHVEMFGGYYFQSFDSNGNPVLGINFANRGDNNDFYGVDGSNFLCRP